MDRKKTVVPGKPANDTAQNLATDKVSRNRRIQDNIAPKDPTHKLNLDRRVKYSDRRKYDDPNYRGAARRMTIDRRVNTRDRRLS